MKDCWDKILIVSQIFQILGIIAIPIVIAVFGWKLDSTLHDKDIKIKYIEIAVGILKDPPIDETKALRSWAVDVLAEYPDINFTQEALDVLKKIPLPTSFFLQNPDGSRMLNPDGSPAVPPK